MKKNILAFFSVFCIFHVDAAVICHQDVGSCALYFDKTGSLTDRSTSTIITGNISNIGMFSDASIYKYGNQYALIQESRSSDRLVTVIPLSKTNNEWIFSSIYYFSVSLMASSVKSGPLWQARKIVTQKNRVSDDIWDRAGDLASERRFDYLVPSGWPDTRLYVASIERGPKGEKCFVPFDSLDSSLPINMIACRSINLPINDGHYDLSGVIQKNIFIDITFTKKGGVISGQYRRLKYPNKSIKIEGTLTQDGTLSMIEFGESDGGISGYFSGSIKSGKFSGEWEARDKSRRMPFSAYMQGFL